MTHTHLPPDPGGTSRATDLAPAAPAGGTGSEPPGSSPTPPSTPLPKGPRLLVVEHNAILALDAEDMLLRNGAAQVEVASTAAEALQWLDRAAFDAAVVDLELTEHGSLEVACRLVELGIPFVFAAGYGGRAGAPAHFEDRLVLRKPCSETYLISRLAQLLSIG